jgi:hypothetical protein
MNEENKNTFWDRPFGDAIDLLLDHPDFKEKFLAKYPQHKEKIEEEISKKLDTSS